ncbi:MAG: VOC family protein [Dokdonella sp.]|uniref:VOC family protein n=1 Tax=Dokdonella sp. TaxID=2291710 RepID=UPI003BAFD286
MDWYTRALDFQLLEDTPVHAARRWVRIVPRGSQGACLLLARAVNDEQASRIRKQAGGRVPLFRHTDDFKRDRARMQAQGVHFREEPRHEDYGTAVVFEDLYGNLRDLIEPKTWART